MNPTVPVVKMSGAGNDFIVVHRVDADRIGSGLDAWVTAVCRRGTSIGADGVLIVEAVGEGRVRAEYRNPDGSVAFCGNGTRCAARFAHHTGMTGPQLVLETAVGDVDAVVRPRVVEISIPAPRDLGDHAVAVEGVALRGRRIEAGVPHFVVDVPNVEVAPLADWGPVIRRHPSFGPAGTNLDVVAPRQDPATFDVRTWERGVEGETLACGSGAIAAALAVGLRGAPETVTIVPRSGRPLEVTVPRESGPAVLTGDARVVLEGTAAPGAAD